MSAVTSKVHIYDLAKELKIDTKRLIEDVRREGVDVSVPSNSISKELAEKIREKYFPKKNIAVKRAVRLLKKAVPAPPPSEDSPSFPSSQAATERVIQVDSQTLENYWNSQRSERTLTGEESQNQKPSPTRSKVRLYDLAKDLKIDVKRLIQEVRREGVDVSVPSNSISRELAEKIREKYFPKNLTVPKRTVKVVTTAPRPIVEEAVSPPAEISAESAPAEITAEPPPPEIIAEPHQTEIAPEPERIVEPAEEPTNKTSEEDLLPLSIDPSDDVLSQVRDLVNDYAGVILTGPPGTSKTWYARQIAAALTDRDKKRVRFVQFHQSYQYEDFVEGYVPREDGNGFQLRPKHLLEMCEVARKHDDQTCVMIIDELSRSDPGRVFGEALTYIEPTLREVEFYLSSGNPARIPRNLFFLATMNPLDRGVDEVDAALDRRFAKIAMEPSVERLRTLLDQNGLEQQLKNAIVKFFEFLLKNPNERCRIGHAYFRAIRTEADLRRLWEHQLRFHMEKAFRLDRESFRHIELQWQRAFPTSR